MPRKNRRKKPENPMRDLIFMVRNQLATTEEWIVEEIRETVFLPNKPYYDHKYVLYTHMKCLNSSTNDPKCKVCNVDVPPGIKMTVLLKDV
jgi:hypothetical protein